MSQQTAVPTAGKRISLVERASAVLDRGPSRRSVLVRAAMVGSALSVSPLNFLLRPGTAYAAVCGVDSTCGSGYTAFCCTINNGLNRCPPGSLVGGWWKSDNSGFCCGNARYYIDCHSFCSCGCESGRNFCGEGCRNCSCGCGPSGQCDQRKVCCNNFRYGQCNQGISCTGPVWCRVVTCTPPWRVPAWNCSTTSAADQRTNDHGAPCLLDCTPIGAKYTAVGGPGSYLGEATTTELGAPDRIGRFTHYAGGSIYWHPSIGAFAVQGAIRGAWQRLRWETGPMGYPVTDELRTPDGVGRYNHFTGGSIYWYPTLGAFGVWGAIRQKWAQLRWETGPLGYPVTDEPATPDGIGRFNHFTGGSIYWYPTLGAFAVWGAIRQKWAQLSWELGPLGYPVTDETPTPDRVGRFNHFTGGSIYWHPSRGAFSVRGAIRDKWAALRWEGGPLGYPISDQLVATDGKSSYNHFAGGSIHADAVTGAHAVWGAIWQRWAELGGQGATLGSPLTSETPTPDGVGRFNHFTGGSIYWHPRTGAHSVTGPIREAWLSNGGPTGRLGFPTSEPYRDGDGLTRSDFEGGSITHDPSTREDTVR